MKQEKNPALRRAMIYLAALACVGAGVHLFFKAMKFFG